MLNSQVYEPRSEDSTDILYLQPKSAQSLYDNQWVLPKSLRESVVQRKFD